MSRPPTHPAVAAVAVRALASALTADFSALAAHSGPATWSGPAATAHQARTARAAADARAVATELARVADALDRVAADAAATAAADARRQSDRLAVGSDG